MMNTKRLRLVLGIAVILIVTGIVTALFFSSERLRKSEEAEKDTAMTAAGTPSIQAEKLKYTESEGGKTLYEIESGQAKFFKDEARTEFKDVKVTFYYQDQYEIVVSGKSGLLNTDTKDITISDDVKITAAGDYTMSANSLTYNADRHEIYTDDVITVTGPKADFSGKGLSFNLDTEELFIKSDVTTDIIGESTASGPGPEVAADDTGFTDIGKLDSPVHIAAGGFMGSRKGGFFRYTGGTVATYKDSSLTAPSITVYLNPTAGKIQKIVADGGARLNQADIKGTAGSMTLDYVKKVLTMEHNPVIARGDNILKADKILYLLDEKKSVALGSPTDRAHMTIYPQENIE